MPRIDPDPLQPGDTLAGRYRLVRPLGEGGMGFVWEARQLTTEKAVAIKVLRSREAADAARFLREAKVAAQITHRNVVQVFDFWDPDGDGSAFMVMELLTGEALSALLARSAALTVEETLGVVVPVAGALRAAHAQGIVHRDLKPENVFLARSSESDPIEVKVLDFGLARPVTANTVATAITQTGSIMGTPFYMSPEQIYGEKGIDTRADVWALGVVIYECLSGQKPFGGENFGQVFRAVTHGAYRPLSEAAPQAPPVLAELVVQMLSHDRDDRPNILSVCEALATLRTPSVASLPPPPPVAPWPATLRVQMTPARLESSPPPPAPTMIAASTSVRRSAPAPPRRGAAWAVAGLATAAVAVGVVLALRPSTERSPSMLLPPPPQGLAAPALTTEPPAAIVLRPLEVEAGAIPVASTTPVAAAPMPAPAVQGKGARRGASKPSPSSSGRAPSDPLNAGRF
jgi:serine/threonine protein kinase